MAEKRMFTQKIIDSDAFLEMPLSAQALYFHLNMRADDDGFVNNPKKVARMINASEDDLKILIVKRFLIAFESGVIVIKHWRMHNSLRMDRYHPTDYTDEFSQLGIKENNAYTDNPAHAFIPALSSGNQLATSWQPNGNQMEPENRLDKIREDKNRKESICEEGSKTKKFVPPTLDEVREYCKSRNSSVDPLKFFEYYSVGHWIDSKGKPVKNWKQRIITWEGRESNGRGKNQPVSPAVHDGGEKSGAFQFEYDV